MERVKGIEPSRPAWKAGVLPLNYTRFAPIKAHKNGGPEQDRTADLLIANEALSQLSYRPKIHQIGDKGYSIKKAFANRENRAESIEKNRYTCSFNAVRSFLIKDNRLGLFLFWIWLG